MKRVVLAEWRVVVQQFGAQSLVRRAWRASAKVQPASVSCLNALSHDVASKRVHLTHRSRMSRPSHPLGDLVSARRGVSVPASLCLNCFTRAPGMGRYRPLLQMKA